jgi:hypothetical protein
VALVTPPETVGDLDPDREVYVRPSANVGSETRAHLHNDADACWYTGDLRAVRARVLFDDQPVCQICAEAVADRSADDDAPAIEDHDDRPPWAPPEVADD